MPIHNTKPLLITISFILILIVIPFAVNGEIPKTINYQGYLTNQNNAPLNGSPLIKFSIYDIHTGGIPLWSETKYVPVTDGIFNVYLGSVIPINLHFDKPYYLGITVENDDEMSPRQRLASSPYVLSSWAKNGSNLYYNSGKVGIGTSDPGNILHLKGKNPEIYLDTTDYLAGLKIRQNGSDIWSIAWNSGSEYLYFYEHYDTPGTKMVIKDGTGNVGIGTTNPSYKLVVEGDNSDSSIIGRFRNSSSSKNTSVSIDSSSGRDPILYFSENNQTEWSIRSFDGDGDPSIEIRDHHDGADQVVFEVERFTENPTAYSLTFHTTINEPAVDGVYNFGNYHKRWYKIYSKEGVSTSSDVRRKDNIKDLEYGLDHVMRLHPVSFCWKDDEDNTRLPGLIAQEVEIEIPEVVDKPESKEGSWGINYGKLIPVLTKAIQDQQKQIQKLVTDNEALKARVESIERKASNDQAGMSLDLTPMQRRPM